MIKKIYVENLRLGMYIHDLNCGWGKHKFFWKQFMIRNQEDLDKFLLHPSREVYIDTVKGLDVMDSAPYAVVEEEIPLPVFDESQVYQHDELPHAKAIRTEANEVVTSMLNDVRLGRQVRVERIEPVVTRITDSILRNPGALVSLCRLKEGDSYTFQHCVSMATLLVAFCRYLEVPKEHLVEAGIGGMLHDVGKMRIPNHILNKPQKLESEEFEVMKLHVNLGVEILQSTEGISDNIIQIVEEHHERFDGTGYPKGIGGENISLLGRMTSIVDVYDAITSNRIYQKSTEPATAIRKLYGLKGQHFDPRLLQLFIQAIGIYPTGSLVLLESGRLGVVISQGQAGPSFPILRIVFDADKNKAIGPYDIDLSDPDIPGDAISHEEDPLKWKINPYKIMGVKNP